MNSFIYLFFLHIFLKEERKKRKKKKKESRFIRVSVRIDKVFVKNTTCKVEIFCKTRSA